ncbi:MAG: fibronectin type III domain-containing protein, partial [Opitutales bacterium]
INTVTDSFSDAPFSHPDDWEVGRLAYYGAITPYLTAGNSVPLGDRNRAGQGWLRLTNNTQQQAGYIRYKGLPIASKGLTIYAAFDFVHWDSSLSDNTEHKTVGGDGSSFFIYDANNRDNFHPGAKGGSLGYAQINPIGSNSKASGLAAVAANSSRVDLYWRDNTMMEDGFQLERRPGSGGAWQVVATLGNDCTNYTDTGLAPNTGYSYRVRAYGSKLTGGATDASDTVNVTTLNTAASDAGTDSQGSTISYAIALRLKWQTGSTSTTTNTTSWTTTWTRTVVETRTYYGGPWTVSSSVDSAHTEGSHSTSASTPIVSSYTNSVALNIAGTNATCTTNPSGTLTGTQTNYTTYNYNYTPTASFRVSDIKVNFLTNATTVVTPGSSTSAPSPTTTSDETTSIRSGPTYSSSWYTRTTVYNVSTTSSYTTTTTVVTPNFMSVDYVTVATNPSYQAEAAAIVPAGAGTINPTDVTLYLSGSVDYATHPSAGTTFSSGALSAPASLAATALTTTSIGLTWPTVSGATTGVRIQYKTGSSQATWSSFDVPVASLTMGGGNTSYTHTGLYPGVLYTYRVRTINGAAFSVASPVASTTTTAGSGTMITVRALGTTAGVSANLQLDPEGDGTYTNVPSFTLGSIFNEYFYYTADTVKVSAIRVNSSSNPGDVLIDRIEVNGVPYEAENCTSNTGGPKQANSLCAFSEWLNDAGYIDFSTFSTGRPIDPVGGLSGGYIGVGMDDWGNFSWEGDYQWSDNEGRVGHSDNTTYQNSDSYNKPGYSRHAVAVRGDEASHYKYLVGTGDMNVADLERSMNFPKATERPTLKPDLRRLSMIITPDNQLTVFIKYGTGDTEAMFTADLSTQIRPQNILFGFASASGGATNYHEIRNVVVVTFKSLIWDGEHGNREWDTGMNWLFDDTPKNSNYEDVEFESEVRRARGPVLMINADGKDQEDVHLTTPVAIHTITLSAPDIIYRLWGSLLTLNNTTEGASLNATGGKHLIDCNVLALEEFNFNATEGATLIVNGDVDNGGYQLRLTGKGTMTLDNVISGAGGLRIEDDGVFTFTGGTDAVGGEDNTYDGVNLMQEGSLFLNKRGPMKDPVTGKYAYRSATGAGPIILSSIESITPGAASGEPARKASRITLSNNNQIDNNADINLDGGEIHLGLFNECGDD